MLGKHILVVEDSCDHQYFLETYLKSAGYGVTLVANGEAALKTLREHPELDLVVLDIRMPLMDGITFRHIQEHEPLIRDIPVVLYSNESSLAAIAADLHVPHYVSKLDSISVLLSRIRSALVMGPGVGMKTADKMH